jgi:hypothetical protein
MEILKRIAAVLFQHKTTTIKYDKGNSIAKGNPFRCDVGKILEMRIFFSPARSGKAGISVIVLVVVPIGFAH